MARSTTCSGASSRAETPNRARLLLAFGPMRFSAFLAALAVAATAFAADAPPPKDWTGSVGAGLAVTTGNTDTQNFNLAAGTKYDPKTKFVFKADALYLR